MRPILIQIGELGIPSYGIMLAVSFLIAILLVKRASKHFAISPVIIENLAFYVMLGVIIGGRFLYVMFHWPQYEHDLLGIIRVWEGGMMFYGGFLGALVASLFYLQKEKLSVLLFGDLVAPAIALGEFFTRIGCFLNGCCFGTPSRLPWAVTFPENCVAGGSPVGDYALHPTQIYTALFSVALFFFLNRRLYGKHKTGEIFSLYLIFSGIFRFSIDFIRYFENGANFWINQIIAVAVVLSGALIFSRISKKK